MSKCSIGFAALLGVLVVSSGALAQSTLLPEGIFNPAPANPKAPASISADLLSYDSNSDVITAEGDVVLGYENFVVSGNRLVFNKKTNDANFVGPHTHIPFQFVQDIGLDIFICTGTNRHSVCLLSILSCFHIFTLPGPVPDSLINHVFTLQSIRRICCFVKYLYYLINYFYEQKYIFY